MVPTAEFPELAVARQSRQQMAGQTPKAQNLASPGQDAPGRTICTIRPRPSHGSCPVQTSRSGPVDDGNWHFEHGFDSGGNGARTGIRALAQAHWHPCRHRR